MAARTSPLPLQPALALLSGAGLLLLAVYAPALSGPFVSDDVFYVARNPYVQSPSLENLRAILWPSGGGAVLTLNYAPVHLLLHSLQWQLFGSATRGYHLTSLALHLATGAALYAFYRSRPRLPRLAAVIGTLVFLFHPANVEAVAWIFQIKTVFSLLCGLLALVCFERRPALASLLFTAGLLTKISAAFALPVLATQLWCRHAGGDRVTRREAATLGAWLVILALVAVPVGAAIARAVPVQDPYPDAWVHARSIVALAMRYVAMAAVGYGTATFQEPAPALSPFDPWWLAGLVAGILALARAAWVLRRGDPEAVYWVFAFASFVPVSQIFAFPFPLADRYLYAILPALLGVALCGAVRGLSALEQTPQRAARLRPAALRGPLLARAAVGISLLLCVFFAVLGHARARVWSDESAVVLDAARAYPDGLHGQLVRAREAAQRGDGAACGAALQAAFDRGARSFAPLLQDPAYAGVRDHPAFRAAILQMASWWIERLEAVSDPIQSELWTLGSARWLMGDLPGAIEALEQAAALGGPDAPVLLRELDARRLEQRLAERLGHESAAPRVAPPPRGR